MDGQTYYIGLYTLERSARATQYISRQHLFDYFDFSARSFFFCFQDARRSIQNGGGKKTKKAFKSFIFFKIYRQAQIPEAPQPFKELSCLFSPTQYITTTALKTYQGRDIRTHAIVFFSVCGAFSLFVDNIERHRHSNPDLFSLPFFFLIQFRFNQFFFFFFYGPAVLPTK